MSDPVPQEEAALDELLLEMKDTSELMVDLAYSSLLYDNRDIAREVFALEDEMDAHLADIQRQALSLHQRGIITLDHALATIRLAESAEVIADGATTISDVVLRDVEIHPVFRQSLRESDAILTRVEVQAGSTLAGRTLGEERVSTETGMHVIALRRGARWLYGPRKSQRVEAGDVLLARGPEEGEAELRELAGASDAADWS